jgi:hypothetical protein
MADMTFMQKKERPTSKSFPGKTAKAPRSSSAQPSGLHPLLQLKRSVLQEEAYGSEVNRLAQSLEPVQRQVPEEEELLEGKFAAQRQDLPEEEEVLAGKFAKPVQQKADDTGMPEDVRANMENSFQTDFSDVTVHPNSSRAPDVGAIAYTQGTDIHFAPGQYKPDTSSGRQLLAHELTHVQQQREGKVKPTTEVKGLPVNDDPSFEKEADNMGKKVS